MFGIKNGLDGLFVPTNFLLPFVSNVIQILNKTQFNNTCLISLLTIHVVLSQKIFPLQQNSIFSFVRKA